MKEDIWGKLDENIVPVVKVLNGEGITTFASCGGHEDEIWPWVNCRLSEDYGEEDIINALMKHGYCGFSVSRARYVNSRTSPMKNKPFWSIMFWTQQCLVTKVK